jgi:molybdopterin synthase sulfur carrier subunit
LITVHITGHLKDYTGKKRDVQVSGAKDVASMLEILEDMFPGIRNRILDDQDRTRPYVNIFVNGINIKDEAFENTTLKEGDTVHILPSVAGG